MSTLFRKQATDAFYSTEARGGVLTIAPPRTVAVFALMTCLLVSLVLAAAFGSTQIYSEGRGVVRPDEPPLVLRAEGAGTVLSIEAVAGGRGKAGSLALTFDARSQAAAQGPCAERLARQEEELDRLQQHLSSLEDAGAHDPAAALVLIAEMRPVRERVATTRDSCEQLARVVARSRVTLPVDATVDDIAVAVGSQVREGDALLTLVPTSARLVGYISVPEAYRNELVVGRAVRLKFDALPFDSAGVGSGTVTRILDALPAGVKLEGSDASVAYAETSIDRMPGGAFHARAGMTFTADIFVRTARLWTVLLGGG